MLLKRRLRFMDTTHFSCVCVGLFFILCVECTTPSLGRRSRRHGDGYERRLLRSLLHNYDPDIRPVREHTATVTVELGLSLHQIIDLDERNQILNCNLWIRQKWTNPLLMWDPRDYSNISSINVDPKKVWRPDIYLYNNADRDSDGGLDKFNTKIQLFPDGTNMWLAPVILKSTCRFNVAYFPFDEQSCHLKFGSWTYDGYRLDIEPENGTDIGIDKFVSNGEWELKGVSAERNVAYYACCVEPYPDITFTLKIRRMTLFYYMNMLIPCFLITGLTLLSYILPPESGERITLVTTSLLALTVFMLLVGEIIPPVADVVPLISIYYVTAMFMVGLSLAATCVVLRCYYRPTHRLSMPVWLRFLMFDVLAKITGKLPSLTPTDATIKHIKLPDLAREAPPSNGQSVPSCHNNRIVSNAHRHAIGQSSGQHHTSLIHNDLAKIADILTERDETESFLEDWKKAAIILDKLFLWVFIALFLAATVAVFLAGF